MSCVGFSKHFHAFGAALFGDVLFRHKHYDHNVDFGAVVYFRFFPSSFYPYVS